jgi:hypothetical protein
VWHAEFRDARLVEVYDAECRWGRDDDYFVSIVGTPPVRVATLYLASDEAGFVTGQWLSPNGGIHIA